MHKHYVPQSLIGFLFALCFPVYAQSPSDALLMQSGQACVLVDGAYGNFDRYWEGNFLRENQTIATVSRNSLMPMVALGITKNLTFFAGAPYISTESSEPNGGRFEGASGFQDLLIAAKYRFLNWEKEKGHLTSFATLGFSTPVSNYLPDYMPYSLGLGAPELSYRLISQYQWKNGWYVRLSAAYLWRGYAQAEREYYYNNGSYYTTWMDVPNAINMEGHIGIWTLKNALQLELGYTGSKSTSGDDIRPYSAPQPTNNIDTDRVGIFAHYYVPSIKGLGFVAYHNRVVNGRNAAKINTTGFGITYFFDYLKKQP